MTRLEGNGASRFIQLMQKHGGSKGIDITVATVTKTSPLSIRLDGDPFDLSGDEIIVSEYLLKHTRQVDISDGTISGRTASSESHTHNLHSFGLKNAWVDFKSGLYAGDKVIVVIAQDGQLYYVLDKVV